MTRIHRLAPYLSIGTQVAGLAIGMLCNLVLARVLGADGYGVYSVAYTVVSIIGMPLEVGLAMVMVREIAALSAAQDWPRVRGAIRASMIISMLFSVLWVSGCAVVLLFSGSVMSSYAAAAPWAVLLLPIAGLASVRGSILRGLGYPLWGQAMGAVLRPSLFLMFLLVVLVSVTSGHRADFELSPGTALALNAFASLIALGVGILLMARLVPSNIRDAVPKYEWRRWLADVPGYSLMAAAFAANQAVGSMMLAYFAPPQDVGIFRVAELGASLVAMPLGALAIHYSADISRLIQNDDAIHLRDSLQRAARVAIAAAAPVGLLFLAFGEKLVAFVFGKPYEGAALPLAILSTAQLANTMAGLGGIVMSMGGRHHESLAAVCFAMGLQLVLGLWLVPHYSVIGAAVASAVATVAWSQILRLRVQQIYRVSTSAI